MNPKFKNHKIIFDSNFQSGNLDSAIKVNENEYDLVLRIDSNTAGHIMWYYFKVTNTENKHRKIKFNIVNLRKNKSCYQRVIQCFIKGNETVHKEKKSKIGTRRRIKQLE